MEMLAQQVKYDQEPWANYQQQVFINKQEDITKLREVNLDVEQLYLQNIEG